MEHQQKEHEKLEEMKSTKNDTETTELGKERGRENRSHQARLGKDGRTNFRHNDERRKGVGKRLLSAREENDVMESRESISAMHTLLPQVENDSTP